MDVSNAPNVASAINCTLSMHKWNLNFELYQYFISSCSVESNEKLAIQAAASRVMEKVFSNNELYTEKTLAHMDDHSSNQRVSPPSCRRTLEGHNRRLMTYTRWRTTIGGARMESLVHSLPYVHLTSQSPQPTTNTPQFKGRS